MLNCIIDLLLTLIPLVSIKQGLFQAFAVSEQGAGFWIPVIMPRAAFHLWIPSFQLVNVRADASANDTFLGSMLTCLAIWVLFFDDLKRSANEWCIALNIPTSNRV